MALFTTLLVLGLPAFGDAAASKTGAAPSEPQPVALASQMEGIKHDLVLLKRDLTVLEEKLLYPASSQVAVFLSMDVGEFFALDSVHSSSSTVETSPTTCIRRSRSTRCFAAARSGSTSATSSRDPTS